MQQWYQRNESTFIHSIFSQELISMKHFFWTVVDPCATDNSEIQRFRSFVESLEIGTYLYQREDQWGKDRYDDYRVAFATDDDDIALMVKLSFF